MEEYEITVLLPEKECREKITSQDVTLGQLAEKYQEYYPDQIILAMLSGKLRELNKKVDRSGTLSFVTVKERAGRKTYRRSVTLLLQKAVEKLYGNEACLKVMHSLGEGYYCQILLPQQSCPCGENCENVTAGADVACSADCENIAASADSASVRLPITERELERIKSCMQVLCEQDLPITKHSLKTEEAEALFREMGMHDKERLFHYRRSSRVNLYNLDGVEDYYYGYMAPSTGMLKYYDLAVYEDDFVLLFPGAADARKVEPLDTSNKLFHVLKDSREWSRMLGIGTVGALNDAIAQGKGQDIILLQEALMEEKIGNLAAQIASDRKRKFIMIAGPSSSGKTSFANRLAIQLTAKGLRPHAVSLDDYYADREFCPKNPDGSYDFECLEALDVKRFNEDMTRLLAGETVDMPTFDFVSGTHSYNGRKLCLKEGDVLVIEGIHGLNDRLSYTLPEESKFKIYISALSHLNIDEHSLLPTTDARLIRRIVRDARTRGTSAQNTIAMWPSVRRGEQKYIFPFQESADVMFNSALVYELSVLKVYAEPLLFQIPRDSAEYLEAKRLLKFLDYFLPLPTEGISKNSLLREFVGGSCFHV
jgi:uridine kinase